MPQTATHAAPTPSIGVMPLRLQRKCACAEHGESCARCNEERGLVQRKATTNHASAPMGATHAGHDFSAVSAHASHDDVAPPIVDQVLRRSGEPLDAATRGDMEPRFGHALGHVRVHRDTLAAESARAVSAQAYTVGRDIVFARGEFEPRSAGGRLLLAHELAHVLQQSGAPPARGGLRIGAVDTAAERAADLAAEHALDGGSVPTPSRAPATLQRQPKPGVKTAPKTAPKTAGKCSAEVCWFPIGAGGLGKAGFVHGVINLTDSKGVAKHLEVDPANHMTDVGLHSHVEVKTGHRASGSCQTLSSTCKDVDALEPSANKYEAMFVEYDPVSGPNSNSFIEWTLTDAGIGSSAVSAPAGAQAFGFYNSNPKLRSTPPSNVLISTPPKTCAKTFSKAGDFGQLVDLLSEAEKDLTGAGVTAIDDQIKTLRGLYYGTTWSKDYAAEKSEMRNLGFQAFTKTFSGKPKNPFGIFHCGLYQALKGSQDVVETKTGRHFDFGHAIIALDARNAVFPNVHFPTFGGSGTEIVTWLGDLGGGAGMLATARPGAPSTNVLTRFTGTDFGGSINLEGDVAGFVIGRGTATTPVPPVVTPGKGLADMFKDYLSPGKAGSEWQQRAKTFLQMHGGTFATAGTLSNGSKLKTDFATQIETFACQYLVRRAADGKITKASAAAAVDHVKPCSEEVAETFVNALEECSRTGARLEAKATHAPAPKPAASGTCGTPISIGGAKKKAGELAEDARKKAEELKEGAGKKIDETKKDVDTWRKGFKWPWE